MVFLRVKPSVGAPSFDQGCDWGVGGPKGMLGVGGFEVMLGHLLCCVRPDGSAALATSPDGQL